MRPIVLNIIVQKVITVRLWVIIIVYVTNKVLFLQMDGNAQKPQEKFIIPLQLK
jgi:hypothetical protein